MAGSPHEGPASFPEPAARHFRAGLACKVSYTICRVRGMECSRHGSQAVQEQHQMRPGDLQPLLACHHVSPRIGAIVKSRRSSDVSLQNFLQQQQQLYNKSLSLLLFLVFLIKLASDLLFIRFVENRLVSLNPRLRKTPLPPVDPDHSPGLWLAPRGSPCAPRGGRRTRSSSRPRPRSRPYAVLAASFSACCAEDSAWV